MKIAILSQHFDKLPKIGASSVGQCSRELAMALAIEDDVVLIGRGKAAFSHTQTDVEGVPAVYLPRRLPDLALAGALKYSRPIHPLFNRGYPIANSTARFVAPYYGYDAARLFAEIRPDLILVQHNASRVPGIKRLLPNTPVVVLLHAPVFIQELNQRYLRALAMADAVAGVSKFVARSSAERIGREVNVIRNGVSADMFHDPRDYVTKQAEPRILFCTAVSPEKGAHVLTAAFARVHREFPKARLDIMGTVGARPFANVFPQDAGAETSAIKPYFRPEYGRMVLEPLSESAKAKVTMHGWRGGQKFRDLFASSTLLVMPSICDEAFGLPVVEAMAAGLPVIVSDSGAMPEIVNYGRAGVVVPKGDPEALANAILSILVSHDLAARLGRAGQEMVRANFSWNNSAADFRHLAGQLKPCSKQSEDA